MYKNSHILSFLYIKLTWLNTGQEFVNVGLPRTKSTHRWSYAGSKELLVTTGAEDCLPWVGRADNTLFHLQLKWHQLLLKYVHLMNSNTLISNYVKNDNICLYDTCTNQFLSIKQVYCILHAILNLYNVYDEQHLYLHVSFFCEKKNMVD